MVHARSPTCRIIKLALVLGALAVQVVPRLCPATVAPVTGEYRSMRAELPAPVEDLVAKIRNPLMQIEFLSLLYDAKLLEPVLVDAGPPPAWSAPTRGSSTASAPKASS